MERSRVVHLLLAVSAAAAWGCSRTATHPPALRPVRVTSVVTAGETGELRYSASIQPYQQVSLAFKVGGYVTSVATRPGVDGSPRPLQQGDLVRRGTVLARIRESDYEQKVIQARAQRAGAQATLTRARADAARASLLYAAKSMTRVDYDAARAAAAVAASQLGAAEADLRAAQLAHSDCVLRAPMDAVVLSRTVEVGSLTAPGTVGFELADHSRMKAVFGVPERVARVLRVGQRLDVQSELVASPLRGQVTAIAPSADTQSRVFVVEVTVDDPRGEVRAGTIAVVRVPTGERSAAAEVAGVPLAAVVRSRAEPDGYAVFVVEDEKGQPVVRERDVELGEISGDLIGVVDGLDKGDRVVVTGATLVADGERVRVLE